VFLEAKQIVPDAIENWRWSACILGEGWPMAGTRHGHAGKLRRIREYVDMQALARVSQMDAYGPA